ncbi:MAG TPA: hypothetical protein VHM31_00805 [Polyangia bacterium]|nr:hypothetical protein [Polyangia bacterium]
MSRPARLGLGAVALLCVAVPFFTSTTFFGDDHLFLTFARHVHDPLRAFVTDLHGGEYYRPLWMVFWWLLARGGGFGTVAFAAGALLLHLAAGALVALVLRAVGRPPRVAWTAGALMVLAPHNLTAASWFSATTDLLATDLGLLALWAAARRRWLPGLLATAAACLCKESAYALPALSVVVLGARDERGQRDTTRRDLAGPAAQLAVVLSVVAVRRAVLHGWGGGGEPGPRPGALVVQILAGLTKTFTGDEVVPLPLALAVGTIAVALAFWSAVRRPGSPRARFAPFALTALAAAPLLAAGWAVGARYDYWPAVGLCWAFAEALEEAGTAGRATLAAALLLIGVAQAAARRQDVVSYDRRLAAARRAVQGGVAAGHRVFHVDGGIKDLDLALKADAGLESAGILVLDDVPASFAIVPPALASAARPLVAAPPIPPSGAYRFGDVAVVGLARRGDEPDLSEALTWFPDLRLIRLMRTPAGQVVARDVTAGVRRALDAGDLDGDDQPGQD